MMITNSKLNEKTILLNGTAVAATYKADCGTDEQGAFILLTDMAGSYRSKLRPHELTVNGTAVREVTAACAELNTFIGNFRQGGGTAGGNLPPKPSGYAL